MVVSCPPGSKVTEFRISQYEKAYSPMVLTFDPITTVVRFFLDSHKLAGIFRQFMFNSLMAPHPLKILVPIVVTLLGIDTSSNPELFKNA